MIRFLLLLSAMLLSGCSTFGYYVDAINGHFELMEKSRPISTVLKETSSEELTEKLKTFELARTFAVKELHLPDNDSYKEYADIGRPYAVWNVIAAPKLSIEPEKWCFVFVGCISYRGYFSKKDAETYAKELEKQGYDVYVAGARAYSTLGWFDDPLLNTMMYKSEAARVGILFHEMAHQKIYIDDNSAFNEAFATAVEQEGVKRWFIDKNEIKKLEEYSIQLNRRKEFNNLLINTREKLKNLYSGDQSDEIKLKIKKTIFKQLKEDYIRLKTNWNGYTGYDAWIEKDLNNAHLAIVATYHNLVPKFMKLLHDSNDNLDHFYNAVGNLTEDELKNLRITSKLAD